jgi:hypothetical protein
MCFFYVFIIRGRNYLGGFKGIMVTIHGLTDSHLKALLWGAFLSALSKKTPSSKVGDELRTSSLSFHMTIM